MKKIILILAALACFLLTGNILYFFLKAISKFLSYASETSVKTRAVVIEKTCSTGWATEFISRRFAELGLNQIKSSKFEVCRQEICKQFMKAKVICATFFQALSCRKFVVSRSCS